MEDKKSKKVKEPKPKNVIDRKTKIVRRTNIGGQAVLEGVMMKGPDAIAITVRRPDKTMVVDYKKSEPLSKKHKWMGLPIIRGAVNMVNMLVMGMTTLETSAKMLGTEEE